MQTMRLSPFMLLILLLIPGEHSGQSQLGIEYQARKFTKMLQEAHVRPRKIDDSFSRDVFNEVIARLDEDRIFFTRSEVDVLRQFEVSVDDDLVGKTWRFLPVLTGIYGKALARAESNVLSASTTRVDFLRNVEYDTSSAWAESAGELAKRWDGLFTLQLMSELAKKRLSEDGGTDTEFLKKAEPLMRQKLKTVLLRRIQKKIRPASGFQNEVNTIFLAALARVFDPHSVFLSRTEMENYIASLSTEGFLLGIDIEATDDEVIVSGLLPGGPAWKTGQINNGDRILRVRWGGKEWIETLGMDETEVAELLSESNEELIELVVRKPAGIEKAVTLRKEKISTDENRVRSFVLEGRRRIGYISLPDFYSAWDKQQQGGRSADDVSREIIKLRKENIDGLILDLRFNGGGSMAEAVEMTGIFIDAGPVAIYHEKGKDPLTLKDINRGTVYDGPLVVMVNGLSASASELVAGALQDHRRAIIAGSTSYGKGIGQQIFSVQTGKVIDDPENFLAVSAWGFSTITTSRLYRINGKSVQQTGIIPDITFPDVYENFGQRENEAPFSLPADSINKKTWYEPLPLLPIRELREKSSKRVNASTGFRNIADAEIETPLNNPVSWLEMKQHQKDAERRYENLAGISASETASFQVHLHEFGKPRMQFDEYAQKVSEEWIRNLSADNGLEETFNVICDYIDILERK